MIHEKTIFSIGHSNHPIIRFIELLKVYGIETLVDVRRFPSSKKNPQFNRGSLIKVLNDYQIAYEWLGEELGGLRDEDYETYTNSETFERGLARLQSLAIGSRTCFMCAELRYTGCHRRIIADKLDRDEWRVLHIIGPQESHNHNPGLFSK